MRTATVHPLDEIFLHLDGRDEPQSVHLEAGVQGRLDGERLAEAIRAGLDRHPMARARLLPAPGTALRNTWEIPERVDRVPLETVDCGDDAELDHVRSRLLRSAPSLDSSPPLAFALAHHPAGDALIVNLSHVAGDGVSALRVLRSIASAYAGTRDRLPDLDPLEQRDLRRLAGARSSRRLRIASDYLGESGLPPARIVPEGRGARPGSGFHLLRLDPDETARVRERRRRGATVNDVLLAGLALAIRRWNEQHGVPRRDRRISLTVPVNLRPAAWRAEVVGNYSSGVVISVPERHGGGLAAVTDTVARKTARLKERRAAGMLIDLLELPALMPLGIKRRLSPLLPAIGRRFVDTAMLSNLGRVDAPPDFGAEAGPTRELWFSPVPRMPLGAVVGAASLDGRLLLTLRHRYALFDATAAAAFAQLYRSELTLPSSGE